MPLNTPFENLPNETAQSLIDANQKDRESRLTLQNLGLSDWYNVNGQAAFSSTTLYRAAKEASFQFDKPEADPTFRASNELIDKVAPDAPPDIRKNWLVPSQSFDEFSKRLSMYRQFQQFAQDKADSVAAQRMSTAVQLSEGVATGLGVGRLANLAAKALPGAGGFLAAAGINAAGNVGLSELNSNLAGEDNTGTQRLTDLTMGLGLGWLDALGVGKAKGVGAAGEKPAVEAPRAIDPTAPEPAKAVSPEVLPSDPLQGQPSVSPSGAPQQLDLGLQQAKNDADLTAYKGQVRSLAQSADSTDSLKSSLGHGQSDLFPGHQELPLGDTFNRTAPGAGSSPEAASRDPLGQPSGQSEGKAPLIAATTTESHPVGQTPEGDPLQHALGFTVESGPKNAGVQTLGEGGLQKLIDGYQQMKTKVAGARDFVRQLPKDVDGYRKYLQTEALWEHQLKINGGSKWGAGQNGWLMKGSPEELGANIVRSKIADHLDSLKAEAAANPKNNDLGKAVVEVSNRLADFDKFAAELDVSPRKVSTSATQVEAKEAPGPAVSRKETPAGTPDELKAANPTYQVEGAKYQLGFDSATDKALYQVGLDTKGLHDGKYMDFLREQFPKLSDEEIRSAGARLKDEWVDDLARSVPETDKPAFGETAGIEVPNFHDHGVDPVGEAVRPAVEETKLNQGSATAAVLGDPSVKSVEVLPEGLKPENTYGKPEGFEGETWDIATGKTRKVVTEDARAGNFEKYRKSAQGNNTLQAVESVLDDAGLSLEQAPIEAVQRQFAREMYQRLKSGERVKAEAPAISKVEELDAEVASLRKKADLLDPEEDAAALQKANADIADAVAARSKLNAKLAKGQKGSANVRLMAYLGAGGAAVALSLGALDDAQASTGGDLSSVMESWGKVAAFGGPLLLAILSKGRARMAAAKSETEAVKAVEETIAEANAHLTSQGKSAQVIAVHDPNQLLIKATKEETLAIHQAHDAGTYKDHGALRPDALTIDGAAKLTETGKVFGMPASIKLPWTNIEVTLRPLQQIFERLGTSSNNAVRTLGDVMLATPTGRNVASKFLGFAQGAGINLPGADALSKRLVETYYGQMMGVYRNQFDTWVTTVKGQKFATIGHYSDSLGLEFALAVDDELRGIKGSNVQAQAAAASMRTQIAGLLDEAVKTRDLIGAKGVNGSLLDRLAETKPSDHYVHRMFNHDRITELRTEVGDEALSRVIGNGIRKAQPDLAPGAEFNVAKKYLFEISQLRYNKNIALLGSTSEPELRAYLQREGRLSGAEIDKFVQMVTGDSHGTTPGVLKERTGIDETHGENIKDLSGNNQYVQVRDLFVRDPRITMGHYVHSVAGIVGLGQASERIGFDLTSKAGWDSIMGTIKSDPKVDPHHVQILEELRAKMLGTGANTDILGRPSEAGTAVRQLLTLRYNAGLAFAHFGNLGNMVSMNSFSSLVRQWPSLSTMWGQLKAGTFNYGFARDIEAMTGIGLEHVTPSMQSLMENGIAQRNYRKISTTLHKSMTINGFYSLLDGIRYMSAASNLQRIADHINGEALIKDSEWKHLEAFGLSKQALDDMAPSLKKAMTVNAGGTVTGIDNKILQSLDYKGSITLQDYLFRVTKDAASESAGHGTIVPWMQTEAGKFIMQFQLITINNWNRVRRDYANFDGEVAMRWAMSMALASAGYMVRTGIQYGGNEEERNKRLTPLEIAKAGFRNSSWSAMFPNAVDGVASTMGLPAPFAFGTNSGRSSGASAPVFDAYNSFKQAIGDAVGSSLYPNEEWTKPKAMNLIKQTPLWSLQAAASYAVGGLPDKQAPQPK